MHKWFKDRCFVWEINGVRWYSNGHVLLSQEAVGRAAMTIKNGFRAMETDLSLMAPGAYTDCKRTGDTGNHMVEAVIPKGDTMPLVDTGWIVSRHDDERCVLRVRDGFQIVTTNADYGRLFAIADSLGTPKADDLRGPIVLYRHNPIARVTSGKFDESLPKFTTTIIGLVMPMRTDGFGVEFEDGSLRLAA